MLHLTIENSTRNIFEEIKKSKTCEIQKNKAMKGFTMFLKGCQYDSRNLSTLVKIAIDNKYKWVKCFNMKSSIPISAIDHLESNEDYVYFVQVVDKYYS